MNGQELDELANWQDKEELTSAAKTESEWIFEQYLNRQKVKWRRIPETARPQPDYEIQHAGVPCVFEVKEFDEPNGKWAEELRQMGGGFDPCPPIRGKIRQASRQFRSYKSRSCALVLWNSRSILRDVRPEAVMASAFGQNFQTETSPPDDPGAPRYTFNGPAELRPNANTTISAIVILTRYQLDQIWLEGWRRLSEKKHRGEPIQPGDQWDFTQQAADEFVGVRYLYEGTLRTIVIENPYARIPFPRDLLVGPFDQRWRRGESGYFALAFMGSEIERLKRQRVPFVYL